MGYNLRKCAKICAISTDNMPGKSSQNFLDFAAARDEPRMQGTSKQLGGKFRESVIKTQFNH